MTPLCELATRHGTDKGPQPAGKLSGKGYTVHYHQLLQHRRDQPLTVLEIGVKTGASLRMWAAYLPQARIIGLDINPADPTLSDVATIYQGDQTNPTLLRRIAAEHGPFDVVVDDGSHRPAHHVTTQAVLWPHVTADGWYAIEDLQTCFAGQYGGSMRGGQTAALLDGQTRSYMQGATAGWMRLSPRLVIFGR